jgi:hypothetical protein
MQEENMEQPAPCFLLVVCCASSFFVVDTELANSLPVSGWRKVAVQISVFTFHLSACIIHPLPLRVLSLSQGEKVECLEQGYYLRYNCVSQLSP